MTILISESPKICSILEYEFNQLNFNLIKYHDSVDLLHTYKDYNFDLVILNCDINDLNASDIIRIIKSYKDVPVIALSNHKCNKRKIEILKSGANDYIVKPFITEEIILKVKSYLSKKDLKISKKSSFFDSTTPYIFNKQSKIKLTNKEFEIMKLLNNNFDKIVSKQNIEYFLYNSEYIETNAIRVHICNLRNKFKKIGIEDIITTISNIGFILCR